MGRVPVGQRGSPMGFGATRLDFQCLLHLLAEWPQGFGVQLVGAGVERLPQSPVRPPTLAFLHSSLAGVPPASPPC